jgi:hypothetical protein
VPFQPTLPGSFGQIGPASKPGKDCPASSLLGFGTIFRELKDRSDKIDCRALGLSFCNLLDQAESGVT